MASAAAETAATWYTRLRLCCHSLRRPISRTTFGGRRRPKSDCGKEPPRTFSQDDGCVLVGKPVGVDHQVIKQFIGELAMEMRFDVPFASPVFAPDEFGGGCRCQAPEPLYALDSPGQ